ncbi:MAG: hypothetical protein IPK83_12300 [Planctomycetes bacterium]|nr:hypothetical protein [Planctomycetota bacterium]
MASADRRDGASFWDRTRPHDFLDEVLPIQLSGEIRGLDLRPQESNDDSWLSIQRSVLEDSSNSTDQRESKAFDAAIWGRVAVLAARIRFVPSVWHPAGRCGRR